MPNYPGTLVPVGHIEPVPRRLRALAANEVVLDTSAARYVWEIPPYPQFYVPVGDIRPDALVEEAIDDRPSLGKAQRYGLRVGDEVRRRAAWAPLDGELVGTVRFRWTALDAWFEEDEQVYVHPRSPYTRVDALPSSRPVRIERDGVLLAESPWAVLVFETGLPTRYYVPRTALNLAALEPSPTVTECPYKGTTSAYWTARIGETLHRDLAWSYAFPTRQLLPIAGLVAFYNEKTDISVDGHVLERPVTHFS